MPIPAAVPVISDAALLLQAGLLHLLRLLCEGCAFALAWIAYPDMVAIV